MERNTEIGECTKYKQDDGRYALSIEVKNAHTDISNWGYDNQMRISFGVFDLTKAQIYELAKKIMEVGNQIN